MLLKIDRFQKIVATWFGPILNIVVNLTVDEIANEGGLTYQYSDSTYPWQQWSKYREGDTPPQ